MKFVTLGYSDAAGKTPCRVIAANDLPYSAHLKLMVDAKAGALPAGCARVELCEVQERHIAVGKASAGAEQPKPKTKSSPMKKLVSALSLVALLLIGVSASAQTYGPATLNLDTNAIVASAAQAFSSGNVIDARRQSSVNVQVSFKATGANTGALKLYCVKSVDGSTFSTIATDTYPINAAHNGTTTVCVTTNLPGWCYWKITAGTNGGATTGDTTNLVVKYGAVLENAR